MHEIKVAHDLSPETRVQEMQDRVFDATDVLIDRQPVARALIDHRLIIASGRVAQEIPRRVDEGVHRVRFAARGFATARAIDLIERRRLGKRITAAIGHQIFRQHHRQVRIRHRHFTAVFAMDERDRTSPVTLTRNTPIAQAELNALAAETFGLECCRDRRIGSREVEPGELTGIHGDTRLAVTLLPRRERLLVRAIGRTNHGHDVDVVLERKREIAFIVRRHTHNRAFAITHQHIVGDPHRDKLAGEGVHHMQAGRQTFLLHGGDIRLHGAAASTLVDEGLQRRILRSRSECERMLGGYRHEGHTEEGVDARREYFERSIACHQRARIVGKRETNLGAFAATDPVGLHRTHALRPAVESRQITEQLIRIGGDVEVVHRDLALLDERTRPPTTTIDHLLVGKHGLIDRIPIDDAGALVGDALLAHPQEQPLVPAVVGRITGGDLAIPIDREAERLQLFFHVGDVVARPLRRRHAIGHGGILGRQTEGVPTHRLQHVLALHARKAREHIADGVVAHMSHVQATRGVREHREAVELLARRILLGGEAALGVPMLLCRALDDRRLVTLIHL